MLNTLVRVDRNGTEYHEGMVKCPKCGGLGKIDCYSYIDGGICYNCDGSGTVKQKWKIYTPEHEAKLEEKRRIATEKRIKEQNEKFEREQKERMEKTAKWEAERFGELAKLKYIGSAGDKVEMEVTLLKTFLFDGFYGVSYIHKMSDKDGNILIWKTSNVLEILCKDGFYDRVQEGETVTIKGTIKDHSEYNGEKQTHIFRVKVK